MAQADISDAALVLMGHGSTINAESAASVFQHAAELRKRHCCAEVRESFWKQDPQVTEVLPAVTAPRVFLVPLFISEGYFSEETIPRELGFRGAEPMSGSWRVRRSETRILVYCRSIGTHESMTGVLLARAREVLEKFPFPREPGAKEVTLFIAGHGTEQNENSRKAIERQVELIRARGEYAGVHAVFMEEAPRIAECYTIARTKYIIVVPFFMSDGLHVREDIPVLLGEPAAVVQRRLKANRPTWRNPTEIKGRLVWYSASAGSAPQVADVILERAWEGAGWANDEGSPKREGQNRTQIP